MSDSEQACRDHPLSWAGTLMVEDVLDKLQRETMNDERVQARVRMVNRIHVLEEARHMTYAREELTRSVERSSFAGMAVARVVIALLAYTNPLLTMHPKVYTYVGLDPTKEHPWSTKAPRPSSPERVRG